MLQSAENGAELQKETDKWGEKMKCNSIKKLWAQ